MCIYVQMNGERGEDVTSSFDLQALIYRCPDYHPFEKECQDQDKTPCQF